MESSAEQPHAKSDPAATAELIRIIKVLPADGFDDPEWEFHAGSAVLRVVAAPRGWLVSVLTPGRDRIAMAVPADA